MGFVDVKLALSKLSVKIFGTCKVLSVSNRTQSKTRISKRAFVDNSAVRNLIGGFGKGNESKYNKVGYE